MMFSSDLYFFTQKFIIENYFLRSMNLDDCNMLCFVKMFLRRYDYYNATHLKIVFLKDM